MKKFFFSMGMLLLGLAGFAQTPCAGNFNVSNNGNGGQGCPETYPGDASYQKDGVIKIRFLGAIASTINAPDIVTVQRLLNGTPLSVADIKFTLKSVAADRKSADYCFYSKNNSNLFNGSGSMYIFTIQYTGNAAQACNPISEGSLILPVVFSSFNASKTNQGVSLKWETASEENSSGFEVQRKNGNTDWTTVSFVKSKAKDGMSASTLSYSFTDATTLKGITQYRIKQIDVDGKSKYSEIRSVKNLEKDGGFTVFPNPSKGNLSIVFKDAAATYDVELIDAGGRAVRQFNGVKNTQQLNGLKPGQYLVRINNKQTNVDETVKVLVQ